MRAAASSPQGRHVLATRAQAPGGDYPAPPGAPSYPRHAANANAPAIQTDTEFLAALARETGGKRAWHRVAQTCGVAERTVRGWQYGEQPIPRCHSIEMRRLRAERARRMIAEGQRELAALIAMGEPQ